MDRINRKIFIKKAALLSITGIGAVSFLSDCSSEKKVTPSEMEKGPCSDLTGLSDSDRETRELYRYVQQSPDEEKKCAICNYFTSSKSESKCGSCEVVKGPINPDGYCTSFVKKIT